MHIALHTSLHTALHTSLHIALHTSLHITLALDRHCIYRDTISAKNHNKRQDLFSFIISNTVIDTSIVYIMPSAKHKQMFCRTFYTLTTLFIPCLRHELSFIHNIKTLKLFIIIYGAGFHIITLDTPFITHNWFYTNFKSS